jgi:hypothetical protein
MLAGDHDGVARVMFCSRRRERLVIATPAPFRETAVLRDSSFLPLTGD